ncbi:aspartate aminotransferase family protein [Allopusillimonas soli]|uniref:Aspartate aminotransferase family protein n=1 Tax=Allopusillimonas soli TaxID=659016 RepID=A0A853FJE8_9BURK|nr:aspartate aminotransferase family protein [Allopusillimonas soli]NYT38066.1 aspartate aminotransferase family protein [Allopusillimonas soli]TEA73951.1 aspartate aminotransferase family protein [Allopusillimonas soli]
MTHIFHRNPRQQLDFAVRGEGIRLFDQHGKAYIDASGGAAVSCLGHGHPDIIEAIKRQLDQIAYAHSSFFTTQAAEELADFLQQRAPGDLNHVYFVSGGSEAVEASLKLARQYFVEAGQPERSLFIARRQSYHGNTLGALAIGGNAWRREKFLPLLVPAHHVSPCYPYRDQQAGETAEHYAQRLADELDAKIRELGPEKVAAFLAETVVGATAGALAPVGGYLQRIREVCDRHGVLLILDEVMSGMGRTGHLFACEEDGVAPDIIAIAKGLGAGYQPIGAMIASSRIYDTIVAGSGFFQHGHTYMGHATACAASLAVQRVIERDQLLDNVLARGEQLRGELRQALAAHPNVGDVRGRGLFVGVEFVKDKESKEVLDPALQVHVKLKKQGMANGLMMYPMGGTIDGVHGNHALLAPPFISTPEDISEIVARFSDAVRQTIPIA